MEKEFDSSLFGALGKKGIQGTSLRDLLKAIGIEEGSFYNTLKSKKQLYLECLKRYNDTMGRRRAQALFPPSSAKEGVRGLFWTLLDDLDDPRTPRVCLLARSVSSDVLAERGLQKFVQTDMEAFVGAFSNRLRFAKDSGELPSDFNAEAVAQIIATYLQGLFRTALLSYDRSRLERQIDLFLTSIGL